MIEASKYPYSLIETCLEDIARPFAWDALRGPHPATGSWEPKRLRFRGSFKSRTFSGG